MKSLKVMVVLAVMLSMTNLASATTLTLRPQDISPMLAVKSARLPFTAFNVSVNQTHYIDRIVVHMSGSASPEVISQVVIQANGNIIGKESIGTNGLAWVHVGLILIPGKTNVITIGGDMAAELSAEDGKTVSLTLVGLNYDPSGVESDIIWPKSAVHTVNNALTIGSLSVMPARQVSDQNILRGQRKQLLGGFSLYTGSVEAISIGTLSFDVNEFAPNGHLVDDITNIDLVDASGKIVAGPVDMNGGVITFADTFVAPKGDGPFYLKGMVGSSYASGTKLVISTKPNAWGNVRGLVYGYEIIPTSVFSTVISATMTVVAELIQFKAVATDTTATGKTIKFVVSGLTPNQLYNLEETANLNEWRAVRTVSVNGFVDAQFEVPLGAGGRQFYRLVNR